MTSAPNFFILGAAKSGTTTLYHHLKQHPQIFMSPIKETNFFAFEGEKLTFEGVKVNESTKSYQQELITDINSYLQQFSAVNGEAAIGESCPSYLYIPKAAKNIKHYIPHAKLIIILRDPIERAYSNFLHHVRERTEHFSDFLAAVKAEEERIEKGWWWGFHYVQVGLYYQQIKRYFNLFGPSQIKVYLFDQFQSNPAYVLNDIYQFIEVEAIDTLDSIEKCNSTEIPAHQLLDNLIKDSSLIKKVYQMLIPNNNIRKQLTARISSLNPLIKPKISDEIRQKLIPLFRQDIYLTQDLIDENLSSWLT